MRLVWLEPFEGGRIADRSNSAYAGRVLVAEILVLVAGCVADNESAVLVECDDGGDEAVAIFAGDDGGLIALHEGDEGVGRAKVDSYDACCGVVRHVLVVRPRVLTVG